MAGFTCAGDMRFMFKNTTTGAYGPWSGRIYTDSFSPDVQGELVKLLSKSDTNYNSVIGSSANPQPQGLSFGLIGGDVEMFRLAYLATVSTLTQSSGSVTPAVVTVKGEYFRLPARDISSVTVTSSPAGTTYVLGTDYAIDDASLGFIRVIPGSSLATAVSGAGSSGLNLLAGYTKAAVSGIQLLGALQPTIVAQVEFIGRNRSNSSGKPFNMAIPEAVITPSGSFDLLAPGFNPVAFNADIVHLPTEAAPFYMTWPQGF